MVLTDKPSASLSPYVKSYWMIENILSQGREHIQRIVPTGLLELSFHLGDKPKSSDTSKTIAEHSVITGHINQCFDITITGRLSLFSIYFYPHGLALFLDVPVKELNNQTIPLKYLVRKDVNELEEQLASTLSFHGRIKRVERFLHRRLMQNTKKSPDSRINSSIQRINHMKGMVDIHDLASEACLTRRQFERIFREDVGTSPKQFLKIVRFQHALQIHAANKKKSLTELAFDCGYYDQSHMIGDFVQMSGKSPKEYFGEGAVYSDYFQ